MCQVGIESPPSLNGDAERLLGAIPLEVLQLDPSGRIIFANNRARQRLGIERTDPAANFFEIWEEDPQEVERRVLLAGHSSAWIPLSLTTRRGTEPGSQLLMKVRGALGDSGQPVLMICGESEALGSFEEHSRLTRELNAELAEQRRLRAELDQRLEVETRLRHELVHRTKNNLSRLAAIIALRMHRTPEAVVRDALEELHQRVMAIGLVHDVLDRRGEIDIVDADLLVSDLCRSLQSSICPPQVTIEHRLEACKLDVEEATPLCLLLNELITNALKHAFQEGQAGRIEVSFRKIGADRLEISVADDGCGLQEKPSAHSGMSFIDMLTRQLQGELDVRRERGTRWCLTFAPRPVPDAAVSPQT